MAPSRRRGRMTPADCMSHVLHVCLHGWVRVQALQAHPTGKFHVIKRLDTCHLVNCIDHPCYAGGGDAPYRPHVCEDRGPQGPQGEEGHDHYVTMCTAVGDSVSVCASMVMLQGRHLPTCWHVKAGCRMCDTRHAECLLSSKVQGKRTR